MTVCSICGKPAEYRYVWDRGELPPGMVLFEGENPIYRCTECAPTPTMKVPIPLPVRFVKDSHFKYAASRPGIQSYQYERCKLGTVGGEL